MNSGMYTEREVQCLKEGMGCRPVGVVGDGYGSETAPAFLS